MIMENGTPNSSIWPSPGSNTSSPVYTSATSPPLLPAPSTAASASASQQTPAAAGGASTTAAARQAPGLHVRSCHTCRRRKVKCDKKYPCNNCTKAHSECVFPAPGRAPRRPKAPKPAGAQTEREAELLKRLRRLEGVVGELSGQVEVDGIKASPEPLREKEVDVLVSPLSTEGETKTELRVVGMDEGFRTRSSALSRLWGFGDGPPKGELIMTQDFGKLVIGEGKSSYISAAFWRDLNTEVADVRDMLDDGQEYLTDEEPGDDDDKAAAAYDTDHQSFLFGYSSSNADLASLHPLPSQLPFYWDTFVENVDPLVKIFHIPTMSRMIKEVRENLGNLSKSTEALLFSIYFATVTSMAAEDVKANFRVEKQYLLARYRFGTEQALARAKFLTTTEIVTIQAFVLFLVCVRRHDDSRAIWTLSGLVTRLAQALGLHRDGAAMGLSVFDTEMRRRLWWQILVLDARASEDFQTDMNVSNYNYDCKMPSNYNDGDFDQNTATPPTPHEGATEMTFCLIRYELGNVFRALNPGTTRRCPADTKGVQTLENEERIIRELHDHLDITYLQYCDSSQPLLWVAATIARLVLAKMSLIAYGFRDPGTLGQLPQAVQDRLFISSIEIMEYSRALQLESPTKKWGWLFHTYMQWHAIVYILREVCVRPRSPLTERGWRVVDHMFNNWGEAVSHSKKNNLLWKPMRKLMAKARRKRQADMEAGQVANGNTSTATYAQNQNQSFGADVTQPAMTSQYNLPNGQVPGYMAMDTSRNTDPLLQASFAQDLQNNTTPWILDDSALLDLDMTAADGDIADIDWDGWNDMVRDFQMEVDQSAPDSRGPNLNSVGAWW